MNLRVGLFVFLLTGFLRADAVLAEAPKEFRGGKAAKPLRRDDPTYPTSAQRRHGEGWTLASFVIEPDGSVGDVFIEDSFGGKAFEEESLEAIAKWRYEPAELNGEKVRQCHSQVLLAYHLGGEPGATFAFGKKFKRANRAFQEGDVDEAESQLDDIETRNLYEAARISLLRAQIAQGRGQPWEQARHLTHASIADGQFLEDDLYRQVLVQQYALYVKANKFSMARHFYGELQKTDDGVPREIEAAQKQVEAALAGDGLVSVQGRLPELLEGQSGHARWSHGLVRRIVGLEDVEGEIDHVDLRCDFHRATWEVTPGRAWRIPEEWGHCYAHVFGDPGATFRMIEYPASVGADS